MGKLQPVFLFGGVTNKCGQIGRFSKTEATCNEDDQIGGLLPNCRFLLIGWESICTL
jgi:hypothetical protein